MASSFALISVLYFSNITVCFCFKSKYSFRQSCAKVGLSLEFFTEFVAVGRRRGVATALSLLGKLM